MIKHTQVHLHDDESGTHGDCWPTCVEAILDLPLGTLQRWSKGEDWGTFWYRAMAYLYHHHSLCEQRVSVGLLGDRVSAWGYHIISGPSPRANGDSTMWHAVVGLDGMLAHDPHPSRAGLVSDETWTFLVPVPDSWRTESVYYVAGLPCPCGVCPASTVEAALDDSAIGAVG